MKKKFFALVVVFLMTATAAFAAQEAHSWEELQRLCRVQLVARDNQGNPTTDGGRLGYLRWDVEWQITDDWKVLSGSSVYRKTGEVLPVGSEFYAWFIGGNAEEPTTPTNPTDDKKNTEKEEPIEVSSFEEFAMIVSGDIISNDDGGFGGELLNPLKVAPGQRVLCGSDKELLEGAIVYPDGTVMNPDGSTRKGGNQVYMWLAPEGYGLEAISDLKGLRKIGTVDKEDDGIWYAVTVDELAKVDMSVFGIYNIDNLSDDVKDGLLREDTAYSIFLREEFLSFVPKSADDLKVLAQPGTDVIKKELDRPEGQPERQNYHVRLAGDWKVASNTRVLCESDTPRQYGEVIKAGKLLYISVQPIADPDDRGGDGSGNSGSGDGGGGGCDSGMGSFALLAVAVFLLKKGR